MNTAFAELVRNARSYRRFDESDPVTESALIDLVDLARLAPCGGNLQKLRYRIVSGGECWNVFPSLAWAAAIKDWDGPAEGERPTGYILMLSDAEKASPDTDIGIAAMTIQLGATAKGYATCMLGSIKRESIHADLGLPARWAVRLVIAIGRPGETVMIEDNTDNTPLYWRDDQGVHHVPKLALDNVLIR